MAEGARGAGSDAAPGVLATLRGLAATALGIAQTRLQLLANDLEEQRVRALQLLLLSVIAALCALVGMMLVSALIVIALWDEYRLITLGLLALVYFAGCGVALLMLKARAAQRPQVFSSSLAELRRDKDLLGS